MQRLRTKLRPIEFAVFRQLSNEPRAAIRRVVACVSGGADSLALVLVLAAIRARAQKTLPQFELEVVHVHHGDAKSRLQTRFRDRAMKRVAQISNELGLPFTALHVTTKNDSEEACRDARFSALDRFVRDRGPALIALGHHADDLFETRLIRLIRGTGPQGISAMSDFSEERAGGMKLWRPLLKFSRLEIRDYLKSVGRLKQRDWLEDPSNRDARYLRNAIRRRLLPTLERIRPGGTVAMARSLELVSEFVSLHTQSSQLEVAQPLAGLVRADLLKLATAERRSLFAHWLRRLGVRGVSRAHIEEILKRIDTPRKRLSFTLGGRVWTVSREITSVPESTES